MNIFCNAGGTIFHVDTEPIHQGSLGVNKIRLIGQFPSYSQVLMAFTLPDGTVTKPRYLAKAGELDEIKVENGTSFTVWEGLIGATPKIKITVEGNTLKAEPVKDSNGKIVYDLDYTLTEYYGDVDVQFFVYSSGVPVGVDGEFRKNSYGCLATGKARFTIQKGVPMEVYESDLNYDEPKALLSQILAVVSNEGGRIYNLEFEVANLPAVVTEVIRFDTDLANLKLDIGASISFPKTAFSKQPKLGDKITANCISKDKKAFLLDGEVTVSTSEYFSVKILSIKNLGDADDIEARLTTAESNININEQRLSDVEIEKLNKSGGTMTGDLKVEGKDSFGYHLHTVYGFDKIQHDNSEALLEYNFPRKSGTLALQEDVDTSVGVVSANLSEAKGQISSNTSKLLQVEQIAKGAQQAVSFDSYQQMVNALNSAGSTAYKVGQSIYIGTLNVPDLWVGVVSATNLQYTYTNDNAIVATLKNVGYVMIGHYTLFQLETGKVNMDYTKVTSNGETLSTFDLDSYTQNINKELNNKLSKQGGRVDGYLDVQEEVTAYYFQANGGISYRDDGIYQDDYAFYIPSVDGTAVVDTQFDELLIKSLTENANTLTDEEKAKACEWLGADKKGVLYYSGGISLVNGVPISSKTIPLGDFNITPRAGDLVITSDGYLYEVFAVYQEGSFCTISYLTTLKYTLGESDKTEIKNSVLEALPYYTGEITVEDDA